MKYENDSLQSRLLRGDPDAVGVVSRWVATVVTAGRNWRLRSEWQDLHQEALAGILASLSARRFDPSRDFQSYVVAVTRYTIWRTVRKRRRTRMEPLESAGPEPIAPPAGGAADALAALALRNAVAGIGRPCRELIEAYYFEQRGYEEIATSLGIPVGTVKSRLFRCLDCVRAALADRSTRSASGVRSGTTSRAVAKARRNFQLQKEEPTR